MEKSLNLITSQKNVMVVDDDKLAQLFMKNFMEDFGCKVVIAKSGCEAVNLFNAKISVITMDYNMPEMNGVEATLAIRKKEKTLKSKNPAFIIGITAHDDKETIEACLAAGMDKVFTKPVNPKALEEYLNN